MLSDKFQTDWPFDFGLVYTVALSKLNLRTTLQVQNKGTASFQFQSLLHSYFKVEVRFLHPLYSCRLLVLFVD